MRHVRTCTNMHGHLRTFTDIYGHVQTCTDLYRLVRTCTDLYGLVRTCKSMYGLQTSFMLSALRLAWRQVLNILWSFILSFVNRSNTCKSVIPKIENLHIGGCSYRISDDRSDDQISRIFFEIHCLWVDINLKLLSRQFVSSIYLWEWEKCSKL